MPHFDLEAARVAALKALGRSGQKTLDALELAGLSVVLTAELPKPGVVTRQLHEVVLIVAEDWREPWVLTVGHAGDLLMLNAHPDAVAGIREAVMLRQVMGGHIDVELDDAEGMVLRAWVVEA